MRWLVSLLFWVSLCGSAIAAPSWEDEYAGLLKKYATPTGVRYAAWKKSPDDLAKLEALIRIIQVHPLGDSPSPEGKAFLINAYNLWTLHGVLTAYPVRSVRDIAPDFGFFSQDRILLSSRKISLNTLEKKMLLPAYGDPRIHFAVNCASRSCPPLRTEPYEAGKLESQLDQAAGAFLKGNPEALLISQDGKSWQISSLFDWYASDFSVAGGAVAFIHRFHKTPPIPAAEPTFLPYDWNLNEAR